MRFKNILEWFEFALKASFEEISKSLPTDEYVIFREYATNMRASEDILLSIHAKLKRSAVEERCWKLIIGSYFQPLPEIIAWDLIDRNIAVTTLAHSNQSDAILLALAKTDEAALLRVAQRLYTKKEYPLEGLEKLLNEFDDNYQLLRDLIYLQPSEESKKKLVRQYQTKHRLADDLLQQISLLELEEKARQVTEVVAIKRLLATNEPRVWRALAENIYTPIETLEVLITASGIKYAKEIRHYATMNLNKKKKELLRTPAKPSSTPPNHRADAEGDAVV